MEPNSALLIVVLLVAVAALLYVLARRGRLLVRAGAGVLAVALAATVGVVVVNDYYGYYQTWSQLSADFTGSYTHFAVPARRTPEQGRLHGRVESVTFAGAKSGISRPGYVYLPPQYFQARYRHTRFPAVELLHGTPGAPSAWLVHLDVVRLADQLIAAHRIGPMVLVMPTMSVGQKFEECVNGHLGQDDTYITQDVRADVTARYRVSSVPAEWGVAGYSSGGYCAANLALRHPSSFGAAGILDGYFRPQDGPAAAALSDDASAERANDPLTLAADLPTNAKPLPAFWVSVGTGNAGDLHGALAFAAALHGVEQVPLFREPGATHNFYAWQPAVPRVLAWMWPLLAPPSLRVDFPVAGPIEPGTIAAARPHAAAGRAIALAPRRVRHGSPAR